MTKCHFFSLAFGVLHSLFDILRFALELLQTSGGSSSLDF